MTSRGVLNEGKGCWSFWSEKKVATISISQQPVFWEWLAGAKAGSEDSSFKNLGCVVVGLVDSWGISADACLNSGLHHSWWQLPEDLKWQNPSSPPLPYLESDIYGNLSQVTSWMQRQSNRNFGDLKQLGIHTEKIVWKSYIHTRKESKRMKKRWTTKPIKKS